MFHSIPRASETRLSLYARARLVLAAALCCASLAPLAALRAAPPYCLHSIEKLKKFQTIQKLKNPKFGQVDFAGLLAFRLFTRAARFQISRSSRKPRNYPRAFHARAFHGLPEFLPGSSGAVVRCAARQIPARYSWLEFLTRNRQGGSPNEFRISHRTDYRKLCARAPCKRSKFRRARLARMPCLSLRDKTSTC